MSIEAILSPILAKLSGVSKHQRTFLTELFSVLLGRQGRATFENLARYSRFTELTFRRQFSTFFDWMGFNMACTDFTQGHFIGVFDCTFVPKSGAKTFGLDKFWSSCAGKAQRGLEVSVLACVNTMTKQCLALDATQTPPGISLSTDPSAPDKVYSRVSFYLDQLADCLPRLLTIRYWVGDGFYAKKEIIALIVSHNCHLITRLRNDADLYYLWNKGRQPGQRGPNRLYDGKVVFTDLSRWQGAGVHPIHAHITLYTQRLHAKRFGCQLGVVLLLDTRTQKYILLASTDVNQDAAQIAYYYHLRFQIEILFRDAKQFTGLTQCQARKEQKLDYHFNASLSTVNIARLLLAQDQSLQQSMNALARRLTGRRIWQMIYDQLSFESRVELNQLDSSKWQFWQRKVA